MMKETLKNLCSSSGWCYGVIWGFDNTNPSLLTVRDAYYEEQMGSLIDSMLVQAHVLGRGVIGQAAFAKDHRWMDSDAHHARPSFNSLDLFQEDSELFCRFSMGIKTVSVISVEPWGVVELGSTQKNPEKEGFVDQVQLLFRGMGLEALGNEPHLDSRFFCSTMDLDSALSSGVSHSEHHFSTSNSQLLFYCSATHQNVSSYSDGSLLASYWLHLASGLNNSASFYKPILSTASSSLQVQQPSKDTSNDQNLSSSMDPTDFKAQTLSGLLTVEEFVMQRNLSGLFSTLGLDHLEDDISSTSPSSDRYRFEVQLSAAGKRTKFNNQVKFEGPSVDGEIRSKYKSEVKNVEVNIEESTNEPWLCSGDICAVDSGPTSSTRMQQKLVKTKKKKAKLWTRPRPKDRQMIQDRLAKLRELIPNSEKMSIERLLDRTIRYLNFMQSLKRYAECLHQNARPKSMEERKNHSLNDGEGGVIWAYEVGDDPMVCPLIVEDLSTPGQMLIEILYEEHGLFLEIINIIRGFGFTILKGVMEVGETKKTWGHFLVEAEGKRCITRHEIFSSLIQLLQVNGQTAFNSDNSYGDVMSSDTPVFNSFRSSASFSVQACENAG